MSGSMTAIRVGLVDDHPIVLDGLEHLFRVQPDIAVIWRCRNADEALRMVRSQAPDVLVLDLLMPGASGIELLRALPQNATRVVVLTAVADDEQLLDAVRLGAQGIVLKDMAPSVLVEAVRQVHAGSQWLDKGIGGRSLRRLLAQDNDQTRASERLLSSREKEIVRLVGSGLRNRAIAERLAITEGTVKAHLHNVYEKLNIASRVDLINVAREHGLL